MSTINEKMNHLAFPGADSGAAGLTKREYFAAQALNGVMSGLCTFDNNHGWGDKDIASESLSVADALIELLEGNK